MEPGEGHLRAFVAAELPPALLEKVDQEQRALQRQLGSDLIRWTRPDQLHLTLKFFGNVAISDLDPLRAALHRSVTGVHPFELTVGNLGTFSSQKRPRVLWLALQGDLEQAQKLQAQIDVETRSFGSHAEDRAFKPHLTLGRVKDIGSRARDLGQRLASITVGVLGNWTVQEITLFQSRLSPKGSTYSAIGRMELR